MRIVIVGRSESGTCSMSGKKNTEVWQIEVEGGAVQHIATNRLLECLRMLTAVGNNATPTKKETTS